MKLRELLLSVVLFSFLGASAFAADADKAKKQAEIQKATQTTLERFYKIKPGLKADVAKAPGYAVFTTYGLSFLVGGAGGSGLAHDNATKKNTYMNMAQASLGLQAGISQGEILIIFKSQAALTSFVDKGWEYGGGVTAEAGAADKSVGSGKGATFINEADYYTLTKNGLQVGGAAEGTKFWKDGDLN